MGEITSAKSVGRVSTNVDNIISRIGRMSERDFVNQSRSYRERLRSQLMNSSNRETVARAAAIVPREDEGARRQINPSTQSSAERRWSRMRDDNRHGEVRASVAKYYRYNDLAREYQANDRLHRRDGYLSERVRLRRSALDNELRRRISSTYGEQTWRRVAHRAF